MPFHFRRKEPRHAIVAGKIQVNVVVKQILIAVARQFLGGINLRNSLRLRRLADDFVDARVGAKAKRVQIARESEVAFRRRVLLQFHFAAGALEREFREAVVNIRGLAEIAERFGKIPRRLRLRSGGKQLLPLRQLFRPQIRAMHRRERRKIAQVDGHGGQQHRRARPPSELGDVAQVGGEAVINPLQPRIVARQLRFEKKLQPFPLFRLIRATGDLREPLADARGFQRQNEAHQGQVWHLAAKDRAGAERADDFVVAGIDKPEIALAWHAIARNHADNVRIDGRHRGVDNFNFLIRVARLEQPLKLARKAISRFRVAHGCGFAEHENADGVLRLLCGQIQRLRRAGDGRREKPPAEPGIVREHGAALVVRREEKSRGMAVTGQAERHFHQTQGEQRQEHDEQAETPEAAGRRRTAALWRAARRDGNVRRSPDLWLLRSVPLVFHNDCGCG